MAAQNSVFRFSRTPNGRTCLEQDTAAEFKNLKMSFATSLAIPLGIPIPQALERTNLQIFLFGSHFIFAAAAHSRFSVSF